MYVIDLSIDTHSTHSIQIEVLITKQWVKIRIMQWKRSKPIEICWSLVTAVQKAKKKRMCHDCEFVMLWVLDRYQWRRTCFLLFSFNWAATVVFLQKATCLTLLTHYNCNIVMFGRKRWSKLMINLSDRMMYSEWNEDSPIRLINKLAFWILLFNREHVSRWTFE